jgi:hypothetical protein
MFVPVMMTAQKTIAARPSVPSITIETAGVVVRAECGVDAGWLAEGDAGRRPPLKIRPLGSYAGESPRKKRRLR